MSLEEAGSLDTQSGASYEDTDAQREGHVTTDAEAGVKQLQATDARPPADAAKSKAGSSRRASGRARPCRRLDFGLPASGTLRE